MLEHRRADADGFRFGIVLCRTGLGSIAHVDRHLLSERAESRFDLIETRAMVEVEKAVHIRLRDSEPPCEFHFTETGGLKISDTVAL